MLISSKGRYALRLIYIAALGDAEGKIALREVADREHISQKYLEQLVRPLMKAGLLKSVRGKGGGYMMAKDPSEVRAGDILRAVEGSTAPVACDGIDNSCARSDLCSTVKFWRGLDDVIEKYVDGVTLAVGLQMTSLDKVYKQIEVFARECDAEKVVLFGSRARGDNLPKSDIDIAVAGCRDFGRLSYLIEERLDTLLDVDVVNLDESLSRQLLDEIARDGVILYEKI